MFARTYHPEASCLCSVPSFLLGALGLAAADPGPVLMHLTKSLLWASVPSDSVLHNWHTCVPVPCVWKGCCWEAHIPWRSPWGSSREAERRSGITGVHGLGREEKERSSQRSAGSWAAVLRSSQQPWSLPSLSPPSSSSWPDVSSPGTMLATPASPLGLFFRHILHCASCRSQEMPSLSPHPSYFPAWQPLHKNVYETAESKMSLGIDYLYT